MREKHLEQKEKFKRLFQDLEKDPCIIKSDAEVASKPTCCCDKTSCANVTLASYFRVIKEAVNHAHVIDIDERQRHFDGNLSADATAKMMRKPPAYINEKLVGYKLIDANNFLGKFGTFQRR